MRRWSVLLVAAWLGAAVLTAAVVAPAAFDVLPTRTLAGALVGRVLPVLFISGAVVAAAYFAAVRTEPSTPRQRAMHLVLAIWVAALLWSQLVVTPKIQVLRAAGPIDALAQTDPRRVAFGRLHGVSVGLLGVGMVAALVVLVWGPTVPTSRAGE
ncbi:MAG: DUF4149 domain-containing protein [Gemmatimonadaceae bacterium]